MVAVRKVVKGKVYDTESARLVCSAGGLALFAKRTGEYFLSDGAASVDPVGFERAAEWARTAMGRAEWSEEFGRCDGADGTAHIHASVSVAAKRALEVESKRTGESQSAVIERLIMAAAGGSDGRSR